MKTALEDEWASITAKDTFYVSLAVIEVGTFCANVLPCCNKRKKESDQIKVRFQSLYVFALYEYFTQIINLLIFSRSQ